MFIKSKIETLTASFKEAANKFINDKTTLEKSTMYSADFKADEIRKLKAEMQSVCDEANAKLQEILQEGIDEIRSKKGGGTDFESKLSNALSFINLLGNKLNDEDIFAMVQPFFGDYQTMHRFSMVLQSKADIPTTTFAVSGYDSAITQLKNMQINYRSAFVVPNEGDGMLTAKVLAFGLIKDAEAYEAFLGRLDDYLSASADEIEAVVAKHQRSLLGLK
jgi:hypothetical protein